MDSSKIQARSFRKEIERRVFENTRSMKRELIGGVCVRLVAMKARTWNPQNAPPKHPKSSFGAPKSIPIRCPNVLVHPWDAQAYLGARPGQFLDVPGRILGTLWDSWGALGWLWDVLRTSENGVKSRLVDDIFLMTVFCCFFAEYWTLRALKLLLPSRRNAKFQQHLIGIT